MEAAKTAAINQEIKRVLTEVLLKVAIVLSKLFSKSNPLSCSYNFCFSNR